MSAIKFYRASKQEKLNVYDSVARLKKLKPYAIEKDWWVTQTLSLIFEMEIGGHLLFKGGTSLSKAWHLINRFSEDIDLALNREYLGFDSGLISKTQVKKLRKKSFDFVTTSFYDTLKIAFAEKGYTDVTFAFENLGDGDQDPVSILIYYPAVTPHSEYVLPRIKVEIGSRSLKDPFTTCKIQSFVGEQFPNLPIADKPFAVPCVNPERTLLEKLFLLHEKLQKHQSKKRIDRLSRHLYDITRIYNSEHKKKALNQDLITSIIKHRERFNAMRGVDYNTLFPPHLNAIPPVEFIKVWADDYKTMQTNMIPDESPVFKDLIEIVRQVIQEYNTLKFE